MYCNISNYTILHYNVLYHKQLHITTPQCTATHGPKLLNQLQSNNDLQCTFNYVVLCKLISGHHIFNHKIFDFPLAKISPYVKGRWQLIILLMPDHYPPPPGETLVVQIFFSLIKKILLPTLNLLTDADSSTDIINCCNIFLLGAGGLTLFCCWPINFLTWDGNFNLALFLFGVWSPTNFFEGGLEKLLRGSK